MTKEEAIQILSTRDAHGVLCGYTSGVTEALDMAIEALSTDTEPKWNCTDDFVAENLGGCSLFAVKGGAE